MNDKIDKAIIWLSIIIIASLIAWGAYDAGKETIRRNVAKHGAGHYGIDPLTGNKVFYYHSNTNQP